MVNQTDYATAAFALYRYAPSKPAAVAFDLMFVATTIFHLVQLSRTKTWYMLAFVTGGLCKYRTKSKKPLPRFIIFLHMLIP